MAAMQATGILLKRPPPRDGQGEKEGVQPRIVESFSDVSSRGQEEALLPIRNRGKALGNLRAHAP